jgi:hypothetical protein
MLQAFAGIKGYLRSLVANHAKKVNTSEAKRGLIKDLDGKNHTIGLVLGFRKILADYTFHQRPFCY